VPHGDETWRGKDRASASKSATLSSEGKEFTGGVPSQPTRLRAIDRNHPLVLHSFVSAACTQDCGNKEKAERFAQHGYAPEQAILAQPALERYKSDTLQA
jgi:hypothetical protein